MPNIPSIEKLIDVVASGIGAVAGPLLLPYKAKMQFKANIIKAKGKADFKYLKLLSQFFKTKNCQLQAAKIIKTEGKHFSYDASSFAPVDP